MSRRVARNGMLWSGCATLALLVALSFLFGCGRKPAEAPVVLTGPSGTAYELPVDQVKESKLPADPGHDAEDMVAVITVPPSDTPTIVRVYEKPKKAMKQAKEIITGTGGSPDVSVVSENKDVAVVAERKTGLWPYLAGFAALVAAIMAARKWLKRFSWLAKLMGW